MSTTDQLSEALLSILAQPEGGIVELVDQLLTFCGEHGLELDCHAEQWRFRSPDGDWEELSSVRFNKSVFRAILARLAALCNEQTPNSASPYGGKCNLSFRGCATTMDVTFVNTLESQHFELTPSAGHAAPNS